MVTRKSNFSKPKEKNYSDLPKGRKAPSVNLDTLPDAFRDGVWTVPPGGEVIVERKMSGKRQKSLCIVKTVADDLIETWEETFDKWFCFNPAEIDKNGILVKVLKNS